MKKHIARIISVTVLGAVLTGCATVPGDPYYQQPSYQVYEQPGYIYNNAPPTYYPAPVYSAPPVYRAPAPTIYYGGRDNRDDRWNNGRDRDRAERDRFARDRAERDRAERDHRDQQARDAANRDRARDQTNRDRARDQAERDRRAAEDRRNREQRPGRMAPDSYTPHPQDWRSRQFENSGEKP